MWAIRNDYAEFPEPSDLAFANNSRDFTHISRQDAQEIHNDCRRWIPIQFITDHRENRFQYIQLGKWKTFCSELTVHLFSKHNIEALRQLKSLDVLEFTLEQIHEDIGLHDTQSVSRPDCDAYDLSWTNILLVRNRVSL